MLRVYTTYIFFILATGILHAQTVSGIVADGETVKPLYSVTATNLATHDFSTTDSSGNFTITARAGDTISFDVKGYHTVREYAVPGILMQVNMLPLAVNLPSYVLNDITVYQKDSIAMAQLYSDQLTTTNIKPGWSNANGGGFTGLIGGPVQKISRSYRQKKRFKKNFEKDMEDKYIDTRYTPALVNAMTKLTGDTLLDFMHTYPMEYNFARTASDLEVKLWVKENYAEYEGKHVKAGHARENGVN